MSTYKNEIQKQVRDMHIKMGVIPAPVKNNGIDHDKIKAAMEAMEARKAAKLANEAESIAKKAAAAAAAKISIEQRKKHEANKPKKKQFPRNLPKIKKRIRRIYTPEQRTAIIDAVILGLSRGYSVTQTLKNHGTSLGSFTSWAKQRGIVVPVRAQISTGKKRMWTTTEKLKIIKEAEQMKRHGGSYVQICQSYNVCPSTFRAWKIRLDKKTITPRQARVDNSARDFQIFMEYMNEKPYNFSASCRHLEFDEIRMRRLARLKGYKYNKTTKQIEEK